jgi:hypothetical protein
VHYNRGMRKRNQTPGEKLAFGVVGLLASMMFFACSIGMAVTGKAAVRGHHGVFITPQNDHWGFWGGVVISFIVGAIALVASIRALVDASDDDT